ncbi:MAG: 2-phospho-L-lactate transferase [Pseudomonadota bacterium]
MTAPARKRVLLLSGGVGGAKLAHGFEQLHEEVELWVMVNVGDDFEHLGLSIAPDLDTVLYTLADEANREQGWGLEGESWRTMGRLQDLGGEFWFRLGDLDLATHLYRTAALRAGQSLSEVSTHLARRLNVNAHILPATDQPLRTRVHTEIGVLEFQHYFVRERCLPRVSRVSFAGAEQARIAPAFDEMLHPGAFDAVILAPSNPFLSIGPILAIPGLTQRLRDTAPKVLAVSPLVSRQAIKGPAAKMMEEMELPVSASGWVAYLRSSYGDLVDEWVLDNADAAEARQLTEAGLMIRTTNTIMTGAEERQRLARWMLAEAL